MQSRGRRFSLLLLAAIAFGNPLPVVAAGAPAVALKLTAALEARGADGKETFSPLGSNPVKSGDRIRYDISAVNVGKAPARRFTPAGRIDPHTTFVAGSAMPAAGVEFSLDGGKTWSATPSVTLKTANGTTSVRADVAQFTMIRWVTRAPLAPGAALHFIYEVAVK